MHERNNSILYSKKRRSGLRWLWLSVIVLLLDRLSKYWLVQKLALGALLPIVPHIALTHACNRGAAFSMLDTAGHWHVWLLNGIAVMVSTVILAMLARRGAQRNSLLCLALALILGGALGNLFDRMWFGCVTDFLVFYVGNWAWPAFNLADSAVCVGAVLVGWDALRRDKKMK